VAVEPVMIGEVEERELRRRAGQYSRPYREVIRAKLVLLAAARLSDTEVAARLDCTDVHQRRVARGGGAPLLASDLFADRAFSAGLLMATMQQVGNALGVAVTGVLFFGALQGGFAHAFELSLVQLAVLCVAVAGLTRLLPGPAAES
jgi:hypothetical protein